MSNHYRALVFCIVVFISGFTPSALAHKVRVFAYESGGKIITEAKFNNGRPAKNSTINVTDNSDQSVLLQGSTDDEGIFRFAVPPLATQKRMDLNIIVDVGEGHKGSWLLKSSDYLVDISAQKVPSLQSPMPLPVSKEQSDKGDCSELEQLIEQVVARELAPIKRTLAQTSERKLSLQDILGGLGYIFGLAGFAAYFQSKKTGEKT